MKRLVLGIIGLYQRYISGRIPSGCRYDPTCSHYTYQAIEQHGLLKGLWLGVQRISRCHPLGPSGYDPVPPTKHKHS